MREDERKKRLSQSMSETVGKIESKRRGESCYAAMSEPVWVLFERSEIVSDR